MATDYYYSTAGGTINEEATTAGFTGFSSGTTTDPYLSVDATDIAYTAGTVSTAYSPPNKKHMKFKVGDKIRCFHNDNGDGRYVGKVGKITDVDKEDTNYPYSVSFSSNCFGDHELELAKGTNMLQKLTNALKIRLNPKYHKSYKAGLINGDLELTALGTKELDNILFEENLDKLDKVADDIIEEAEEEKKNR